jgi:glycosyltransferase involved in cell wall biosynthesis
MTISVVIHTKNSEKTLASALNSVIWADEMIVIDMHSTDSTVEIASHYTKHIFQFKDVGYVEPARNFGISKATSDWILILDADEEIPESLARRLQKLTILQTEAWELPRKNLVFGHWLQYSGWWPDYIPRFFKRGSVDWPEFIHSVPKITGEVLQLPAEERFAIIHHNYPTVESFVDRLNKYTTITAMENKKTDGTAFSSFWHEFESRFFLHEGYKDGEAGLHASLMQSFYEAVKYIKQWENLASKNAPVDVDKILNMLQPELAYWRADYKIRTSKNLLNRQYWRIRRKFKL